jgi:hypothetical protein
MKTGVAVELRTRGARGARSRFHCETSQTHFVDARAAPHWQHGGGALVPLLVQVHEFLIDALLEHTEEGSY